MENFDQNFMDSKMDVKNENSPTPSSEYTTSEDEDASRESYGVSSIRIFDNDSQMNGLSSTPYSTATNFAQIQNNLNNLSSSLPSTSDGETMNTDTMIINSNIQGQNGRKRTFSTSESQPVGDRRTATKICRVCGDKAYSYNFNVISCESCKAFFRRNANKEKEIRCPFNDQCDINIVSRRFCQRCRLQKCFRVGMKKEWIMSEEARLEKKQRILDNRERRAAERHAEQKKNSSEELAAAIIGQPLITVNSQPVQQQQQQAVAQVAAALLPGTVTFNTQPSAVVQPLLTAAAVAGTNNPTQNSEVVQLAAAVAQVAAAASHVQPQTFPTQNDPGQMATERALIASIAANSTVPQQTTNSTFVQNQQQIVNQLAVAHAAQVQIEQQLQQQVAVAAVQAAQVQAAAQIVQQHQQQQLVAAVAAAAASTMVPNVTQSSNVNVQQTQSTNVTVPSTIQIPTNDMVTIPRDVLFKLVEQRLEVEQPQQQHLTGQPPKKCQCHCLCGRYPNDLLIVDKVMTDLLETSTRYNHSKPLSQLSPKSKQSTPSTNIMSTSPPQHNFINHGIHQISNVMFQPMCTGVGTITSSTLPINMEDDYVFKQPDLPFNPSFLEDSVVDPDCCLLTSKDEDILNELIHANLSTYNVSFDYKDDARHRQITHSKLDLINMADETIRRLVKMSKCISAFRQLSINNQICLIEKGCSGCLNLRGAMTFNLKNLQWNVSNYNVKLDALSNTQTNFFQLAILYCNKFNENWRKNETVMLLLTVWFFNPNLELKNSKKVEEYFELMERLKELPKFFKITQQFILKVESQKIEPLVREMLLHQ